jgi:hypothetical protein
MLFTRSFGALRARSKFLAATERDEEPGRQSEVQILDDNDRTDRDKELVG